jgi:hypothetical protein
VVIFVRADRGRCGADGRQRADDPLPRGARKSAQPTTYGRPAPKLRRTRCALAAEPADRAGCTCAASDGDTSLFSGRVVEGSRVGGVVYRRATGVPAGCPVPPGRTRPEKRCRSLPVQDEQELGRTVVGKRAENPVPIGPGNAPVGEGDRYRSRDLDVRRVAAR